MLTSAYELAALHSIAIAAVGTDWPAEARAELAGLLVSVAARFESASHADQLRGIASTVAGEFRVEHPTPRALAWGHHA